jgi:late competence protein required for DNA uptake (superfamily II DNA/RNA helicase)
MSQGVRPSVRYRCPNCFAKDIDVEVLYDSYKDEYYCLKCCFVGTVQELLEANERVKAKYKLLTTRITR